MKVFVAGPRAISSLDALVQEKLNRIYQKKYTVLIGDASGADRAVQSFFSDLGYGNVIVFASNGRARNNIGSWEIRNISVPDHAKGFNYYAVKDKAMADDADCGLMIWNGESKGTLNNIINLLNAGKQTVVYLISEKSFYRVDDIDSLYNLISLCSSNTRLLFERLSKPSVANVFQQISLF